MALQDGKGNIAIFGNFSMVTSKPKGFFKTVCMVKILLEICVLQELVLRYYESINKDSKKWFLTPTEYVINNTEKFSF